MMNDSTRIRQAIGGAGLCERCRHAEVVTSARGSRFLLCRRSRVDPAFPKYPPLPVIACPGFEPASEPPADPA